MKPLKVWLASFGFILALGCRSPILAITPAPCQLISEIPGLDQELITLRDIDNQLKVLGMVPMTEQTRNYVVDANEKCRHDQELIK